MRLFCLLFIFATLTVVNVNGLFEDQAGTYDWRQQHVGRPISSHIDSSLGRIFVTTDQNVLGALNLKTGNIVWRKVLEKSATGKIEHTLWGQQEAVLITNSGQRVQGFAYAHGFANWEYNLFSPLAPSKRRHIVGLESRMQSQAYYFTNGFQVCYVSLKDKICVDLPLDGGFFYDQIIESDKGLFVIGSLKSQTQKLHFTGELGSLLSKSQFGAGDDQKNTALLFDNCLSTFGAGNEITCFSSSNGQLLKGVAKPGTAAGFSQLDSSPTIPQSFFDNAPFSDIRLVWASPAALLFQNTVSNKLYVLKQTTASSDGKQQQSELSVAKKIESLESFDIVVEQKKDVGVESTFLVYATYLGKSKLNFVTIDLKTVKERTDLLVSSSKIPHSGGSRITHMRAKFFQTSSNQLSVRVLCMFEDYSLTLFNQRGERFFTREEALAYITTVEFVDFPLLHLQEEFEEEFGHNREDSLVTMFVKRLRTQVVQLREFVVVDLQQKVMAFLNQGGISHHKKPVMDASSLSAEEITRDQFNLNKVLVVVTSIGKVFGLYTGDNGRILWSFHLAGTIPFSLNKEKNEKLVPLYLQRTTAHFPFEPQCAVITKVNNNNKAKSRVFFFNPITGAASKDQPIGGHFFDFQVRQSFLSTQPDEQFLKPLFLLDEQQIVHVLPERSTSSQVQQQQKLSAGGKPVVIFSTLNNNNESDATTGNGLVGYAMSFDNENNSGKPLVEVWRVNLEDEQIVAMAGKLPNDRIHSQGKVLGDRSVLYKYLNPNLVGVVTQGKDGQQVPFINVYLIDTVIGSIVHSFNYKRCRGPVNIVHSENWFFFSYYNIKYRRNEVSSIELFDGTTQYNATHFSSLNDFKPVVFTKSYIVQKSFESMQITLTEKGISTKDIIVACQHGIIIEIPWILIDPRRPIKMTEIEREENLIPYMPEIPLNYEFSLNYYNYVYNIRGIATGATGLESTSLVFSFGLDIYFTRVFPSKTFDMLREDFDYLFISTLMVGLLLGTMLAKKLATSSNMKKAWK